MRNGKQAVNHKPHSAKITTFLTINFHTGISNKIKSKPYFAPGKVLGGSARDASPVGRLVLPSGIRVDVFSEAALLSLIKEAVLGK